MVKNIEMCGRFVFYYFCCVSLHHERYSPNDARYQLDYGQLRIGTLVSAKFSDGVWYRARIVSMFQSRDYSGSLLLLSSNVAVGSVITIFK